MTPFAIRLLALSAVVVLGLYFSVTALRGHLDTGSVRNYATDLLQGNSAIPNLHNVQPKTSQNGEHLAYMTFLSGTVANKSDPDINNDPYFVATRLLAYQLMHQPETRTKTEIPFVILVSGDVPHEKRDRLAKDGATIIEVEYVVTPDWVIGEMPQWKDLMTKLRAWQLTKFSRALFLDGDMILNRCLDDIFQDAATQFTASTSDANADEADNNMPEKYLLATMAEANPNHAYPPTASNNDFKDANYFNAGFFVFGPSQALFDYYTSLLDTENSFDPRYVEQNLLNHAHRQDGSMPWQRIDTEWNIRFPNERDRREGVASMHDKWWQAHMDKKLQPYYSGLRWRMEGFYEARDRFLVG